MNASQRNKVTRLATAQAAAQTTIETDSFDVSGFQAALLEVSIGSVAAGGTVTITVEGSEDDTTFAGMGLQGSYRDSSATAYEIALDETAADKVVLIDLATPRNRYIRLSIARGTANSAIDSVVCHQYMSSHVPVTHDSSVAWSYVLPSLEEL